MSFSEFIPIFLKVLSSPLVIGATIVIFLYCNFMGYIARYKKRPPSPKKEKKSVQKVTQNVQNHEDSSSDSGEHAEDEGPAEE